MAAGGRSARKIKLLDGRTATASIRLRHLPKSRRVYAYLRYSVDGHTRTKYAGDATANTREKALKQAWAKAQNDGLMTERVAHRVFLESPSEVKEHLSSALPTDP
jgi:DNA mismatch endonuclease (patch repair protein)